MVTNSSRYSSFQYLVEVPQMDLLEQTRNSSVGSEVAQRNSEIPSSDGNSSGCILSDWRRGYLVRSTLERPDSTMVFFGNSFSWRASDFLHLDMEKIYQP